MCTGKWRREIVASVVAAVNALRVDTDNSVNYIK